MLLERNKKLREKNNFFLCKLWFFEFFIVFFFSKYKSEIIGFWLLLCSFKLVEISLKYFLDIRYISLIEFAKMIFRNDFFRAYSNAFDISTQWIKSFRKNYRRPRTLCFILLLILILFILTLIHIALHGPLKGTVPAKKWGKFHEPFSIFFIENELFSENV